MQYLRWCPPLGDRTAISPVGECYAIGILGGVICIELKPKGSD